MTYHNDDEIQPTPRVRKVFLEAKSQPLDQHLDEENYSKYPIHVI